MSEFFYMKRDGHGGFHRVPAPRESEYDEGSGTPVEPPSEYWLERHLTVQGKPVTVRERRKSSNNEVISVETVDGWPDGIVFGGVDD